MATIQHIMRDLFVQEPFYAGVMLSVRRRETRDIPTAAVQFNKNTGRFEMLYNPDFIFGMETPQAVAIFKHEMLHIVLKHVTTRRHNMEKYGQMAWNYATDLAINSHLKDELPRFTVSPDKKEVKEWQFIVPGEGMFADYPLFKSSEWYLNKILDDPNIKKVYVQGPGGSGEGEDGDGQSQGDGMGDLVDDHSGWGSGEGDDKDDPLGQSKSMEEAELRRVLRDANKRAQMTSNWGTVPQPIQKYIQDFLEPKIDWRSALRYFVHGTQRANKHSSFKKYNRRYPYQHPGRRTSRVANIAVSIDQSGSVSDQLLAKFFTELNSLAKLATFTVIPFDWVVHEDKIYTWKKGQKQQWERVACGGTNFNAPSEYVNQNVRTFDGHIVLTDMGASKPVPSMVPRLWITDKDYRDQIEPVAGNEPSIIID